MAGSVGRGRAAAVLALGGVGGALVLAGAGGAWWASPVALAAGLAGSGALLARCVQRLGGVTGDVMGACVETALAAALVVLATVR